MNPTPGRHADPLTLDTPESSKTGRTLKETAADFAEMLVEVGPTGEPVPADATPETPTVSAAPSVTDAVAAIPELEEVRKLYGEAGVAEVVAAAHQQHIATEHQKLNAAIPGWSDPETRAQIVQEIRAKALAEGYSEAEINSVTDARAVRLAYAALQRDKLREQRAADAVQPDERETPVRPTQTRRTPAPRTNADVQEALERAAKTGKMRDAAKVFEALGVV